MTAAEIYENLRLLAPSVSFTASKEEDSSFVWDGDGPDPIEEGFIPYDVDVKATTIVNGEQETGFAYLSGCYMEHDEQPGDIHGYLPQKLEEAAIDLGKQLPKHHPAQAELLVAILFLKQEMRDRWQEQQQRDGDCPIVP